MRNQEHQGASDQDGQQSQSQQQPVELLQKSSGLIVGLEDREPDVWTTLGREFECSLKKPLIAELNCHRLRCVAVRRWQLLFGEGGFIRRTQCAPDDAVSEVV